MSTKQTEKGSLQISQKKLLAFVREMISGIRGREDDEHPLPPGPWDPVIREVLKRIYVLGPQPEPWKVFGTILGGGHSFGSEVALNPQPLPPRFAFLVSLAQTVISRAELIQEIADATGSEGKLGGYISKFIDDCITGKRRWPFPGPPPPWWFDKGLNGIDLVVMATQFEQGSKETFSPDLRKNLANASAKFLEAGFSKLQ